MMPGLIALIRAFALRPFHGLAAHSQRIAAFGHLIRMECVLDALDEIEG